MGSPPKRGRPPAFTPARAKLALDAIRAGNTREAAAKAADVEVTVLYDWIRKARAGESDFTQFAQDLRSAEWHAESEMVDVIIQIAKAGNYQAALEWLARRKHKAWGKKDTVKVQPLPDPKALTPAQLESAIKAALETKAKLR